MTIVSVLGAGSWGTSLALLLARQGKTVKLWAKREGLIEDIKNMQENRKYLPGIIIPSSIKLTTDLEYAVSETKAVLLAVPSHSIREVITELLPFLKRDMVLVSTAKGLEEDTLLRPLQIITEIVPDYLKQQITVLAGPSHAEEVALRQPTAIVAAAKKREIAEYVQDLCMGPAFRVYTNPDVVGVELGGALKNVIALATGIVDGLGFGDNTRSALMTRGMVEIGRLGVQMGAEAATFAGLAGIGDLIVTCTSMHSRNRRAGIQLGQGKPLNEVLKNMGMVVEGVRTTKAVNGLAKKYNVELPISQEIFQILFQNKEPKKSVVNLMERGKTHEVEEIVLGREDW